MATFYAYACKTKNSSITNRPHKFDSLVKARKFAARWTLDGNTIVKIYRRDPFNVPGAWTRYDTKNWDYDINRGFLGYVSYNKNMDWHYWNIIDDLKSPTVISKGEIYFKSRPMYNNGEMAGRF